MHKELFKVIASAAIGEVVAQKYGAKIEAFFKPTTDFARMAAHAGVVGASAGVSYYAMTHLLKL